MNFWFFLFLLSHCLVIIHLKMLTGKKHPQINMDICVVCTSNQLFIKRFLNWNKIFKKRNIMCTGASTPLPPLKNTIPSFLPSPHLPPPPLKSTNCPSPPPFLEIAPSILVFREPHPSSKSRIFQWTLKILKFFILITILSFKSN